MGVVRSLGLGDLPTIRPHIFRMKSSQRSSIRQSSLGRRVCNFSRRLVGATLVVSLFFVLTQELQIFPGLLHSLTLQGDALPPEGVDALTAISKDGSPVTVWRMRGVGGTKRVALIFHGNADRLPSFVRVQQWLAESGITSYSVEYRGYRGLDSGWPSEHGLYEDGAAAFELMRREEGIDSDEAIVLGSSIGTGIASHVAATFHPKALVLLSPYTSLNDLVREMPLFGYLSPFLWYRFPTLDNIRALRQSCVIAAHGHRDTVIPFQHSVRLKGAYQGASTFTLLESADAGHNDILMYTKDQIPTALSECFSR